MKTLAVWILILSAIPAGAATVSFEQDGWSVGGPLSVTFAGDDIDSDGVISLIELTDFTASWNTPFAEQTYWRLPDVEPDGFYFVSIDDYVLFVRNPEYSLVSAAFEGETLSSVFDQFLFPVDSSASPASEVPEPSSLMLAGLGLVASRFLRRPLRRMRG